MSGLISSALARPPTASDAMAGRLPARARRARRIAKTSRPHFRHVLPGTHTHGDPSTKQKTDCSACWVRCTRSASGGLTIMSVAPLGEMFGRLVRADRQGRAAKTVETVGWLYLVEGIVTITAPQVVVWL